MRWFVNIIAWQRLSFCLDKKKKEKKREEIWPGACTHAKRAVLINEQTSPSKSLGEGERLSGNVDEGKGGLIESAAEVGNDEESAGQKKKREKEKKKRLRIGRWCCRDVSSSVCIGG